MLHEIYSIGKSRDGMSIGDCQGLAGAGNSEQLLNGFDVFFPSDENILVLEMVAAHHCDSCRLFALNWFIRKISI